MNCTVTLGVIGWSVDTCASRWIRTFDEGIGIVVLSPITRHRTYIGTSQALCLRSRAGLTGSWRCKLFKQIRRSWFAFIASIASKLVTILFLLSCIRKRFSYDAFSDF